MTKDNVKDKIYDYLSDCEDLMEIANKYCEATGNGNMFYEMGDFEDEMSNLPYAYVINMAQNGGFDDSDDYFYYDSYSLTTLSDLSDEVDLSEIADHCVDYDDDLGDSGIRALLEQISNDDFTITLRYSEDYYDTFTIDTLKESNKDRDEYYLCNDYYEEGSKIMTLGEWISELSELDPEDDVEDVELVNIGIEQLLTEKGATGMVVVGYTGRVFSTNEYVDGRPFRWFYNAEKNILLKLIYDADKFDNMYEYKYISECRGSSVEDVFKLASNL